MKPMIWHPEEKDEKVNKYLDRVNHEPWLGFAAFSIVFFVAFMLLMFVGIF
jgi:Fe2+ transport system protein B